MYLIKSKQFNALSQEELYQILKLRSAVFVVEQRAIYLDLDDLDQKATHYFIELEGFIVAYVS